MTKAEKMAEEWWNEEWIKGTKSECDQLLGKYDLDRLLLELIHQVAERTREECQKIVNGDLAGLVATHPYMVMPNVMDAKWEDEEIR